MSKIIFPSSPTIGDEYTSGGVTWKWNGNAWDVLGSDNVDAINVKVNTPVTPDYTTPEVGDTMQDITNKVAGLRENVVAEIITEASETVIQVLTNLPNDFAILIFCDGFKDDLGNPQDNRIHVNFNDNFGTVYEWAGNQPYITASGARRAVQYSTQIFRRIENEYVIEQHNYFLSSREAYPAITKGLNATNGITKITLTVNILNYPMLSGTIIKIIRL